MDKKFSINYIFYLLLFIGLVSMTTYNIFLVKSQMYERVFFLIHAIGQSILELTLAIILGYIIKMHLPKACYYIYIGLFFLFYLTHGLDFALIRIVDLSSWETIDFLLDENYENFLQMIRASGIPLIFWIGLISLFAIIPLIGVFLYLITKKISNLKKLETTFSPFIQTAICLPLCLILWDFTASPLINSDTYHQYINNLPWKTTWLKRQDLLVSFRKGLPSPTSEKEVLTKIANLNVIPEKTPNIFLFIVESLREDFMTSQIAPNLFQFKNENLFSSKSFANANGTQISWFSLFHSEYPLYWSLYNDPNRTTGGAPLRLLKQLGYKIHVFTSAELYYYRMEESLFGKNHHLADSFYFFPHVKPEKAASSDKKAIRALEKEILTLDLANGKNLFVVFLDSTHFDYSWEHDYPPSFYPISDSLDYFKAHHSQDDLTKLKNSYKNSISYVDYLFGQTVQTLKDKHLYDDSVIIFLGDHGEEFYEKGKLFHASHLSKEQTAIPLYYKLGTYNSEPINIPTSHMDVFPTLFHYMFNSSKIATFFSGSSLLDPSKWPYVLCARYNASRTPYEFFFHNGEKKLTLRFTDRKNIFGCTELEIISLKDKEDRPLHDEKRPDLLDKEFKKAFMQFLTTDN